MTLQLIWTTRRGGSALRVLPADEAKVERVLSTLRCEGRLELDGDVMGGVEYRPGDADDRRIKWIWWFDRDAVRRAGRK